MDLETKARTNLAQERQDDRHLHATLMERTEEELSQNQPSDVEEMARERLAETRHDQEHLTENMAERANEELHDCDP